MPQRRFEPVAETCARAGRQPGSAGQQEQKGACYGPVVDRDTHQRFLDYRERHAYFGGTAALLTREQFLVADAEQRELDAKGEKRDDDEEARYNELSKLLFRD
jgi:hypothetical protein